MSKGWLAQKLIRRGCEHSKSWPQVPGPQAKPPHKHPWVPPLGQLLPPALSLPVTSKFCFPWLKLSQTQWGCNFTLLIFKQLLTILNFLVAFFFHCPFPLLLLTHPAWFLNPVFREHKIRSETLCNHFSIFFFARKVRDRHVFVTLQKVKGSTPKPLFSFL